ncbi:MAG: ATPase domain-containing protein [Halovenus sp.]
MTHYSLGLTERDRVDHAFGGGLPAGSVCLLEGSAGTGKSVLTQRMAYGFAEERTPVSVVSTELTAGDYIDQMHSLSYDVVDHLLNDRLVFFYADVDTHIQIGSRQRGTRTLLSRLFAPSPVWDGTVTIVDGFGALLRNDPRFDALTPHQEEDHAMQRIVSMLRRLTAGDRTVVLTVNPEAVTARALQPLRDAADVYLQLETSTVGQTIRNQAVVRRFAGMKNPVDDTIGFAIQQGRGVVIESRTVA